MDVKDIADLIRANISVKPHDAMQPAIDDHIRKQPAGDRHFCTVNGIDRAAGEILKLFGKAG